jgi:hypothetical protein
MLTVGSTPWRRRCGEGRGRNSGGASGDDAGRRRREEARARMIYGAAASYSAAGGGIDRRRRNLAAAARERKWRARARGGGVGFQPVEHSRASEELPRAAADASHLVLRIVQTSARPKKFAAPPRIPRLLECRFCLRARYTGDFFSASAL